MPEEKKGLSWFRLILVQAVIGCILIGICSYTFRIPLDEVRTLSPQQEQSERFAGIPMRIDLNYPGLGKVVLDDPKELLSLKSAFSALLTAGREERTVKDARLLLSGSIVYLDQEDVPFQVQTSAFRFGDVSVNSLNVSANIRKLQSMLIDKVFTPSTIGMAVENPANEVYALKNGDMLRLSEADRTALTVQIRTAARVIDFSRFEELTRQPDRHFVISLQASGQGKKHWLHIDRFNSAYMVVYDLLDETNQRAYFKLNVASGT
ncbi:MULTISPECIES: DUF3919 family protein [Paenibacillus]|uniref:DUF3919 family protein n=1 Tax=Paenibacillus albilobatus TaxID=2716884 RepID=A0A920CC56_9BACL|nr:MULTISPECIES: DUF3919 family protein [Paenibacillus]GIO32533.1 hypothetical protein J2TS6_36740 [Paenibacillus albilobatus]